MSRPWRVLKWLFLVVVVLFIAAQFVRPAKTNPASEQSLSIENQTQVDPAVESIFSRSCNDCHSTVAADLGCAYTLEVGRDGSGMLRVTSGWVELQLKDRESMVPAGAACETRPGIGPGTPYFEDCSTNFRNQLTAIDFGEGPDTRSLALTNVLNESRPRDTLTLWHLLSRVDGADRVRVLEKIEIFVPLPAGVTREGILRLEPEMLARWRSALEGTWQSNFAVPKSFAETKIKSDVTRRMSNFGSR